MATVRYNEISDSIGRADDVGKPGITTIMVEFEAEILADRYNRRNFKESAMHVVDANVHCSH